MISDLQNATYDFQQYLLSFERLGGTWEIIPETSIVKMAFQNHVEYFDICHDDFPQIYLGHENIIEDKFHFKRVLEQYNIPTLKAEIIPNTATIEEVLSFLHSRVSWPVVIKPPRMRCGDRVFCAISEEKEFRDIWQGHIQTGSESYYMVEECWTCCPDYRFMCFPGEDPIVAKRTVPTIFGDGKHTINQLITVENEKRMRIDRDCLCKIIITDAEGDRCLKNQGLTQDSILPKGVEINLRYNTNLSYGGMAEIIDFSNFHPSYDELVDQISSLFPGLPFLSFDLLSFDITKSIYEKNSVAVSEAHITPGIGMYLSPARGKPVDVLTPMIFTLFPEMRKL